MDSEAKIYLERADNKVLLAKVTYDMSTNARIKESLHLEKEATFFNDVISGAYYGIFYSAKAYLIENGIKTSPQQEHRKTYEKFRGRVALGNIDSELGEIYGTEAEKAEILLKIFFSEKRKRGIFTYHMKSEANIPAAEESLRNARKFVSMMRLILEQKDSKETTGTFHKPAGKN